MKTNLIVTQLQTGHTLRLMNILETRDNVELALMESELTVSKAMNEGIPLYKLKSDTSEKKLILTISGIIMRSMQFFNVGQKVTDPQAVVLAVDLLEIFRYETLEDVLMMFKLARQGKIGGKLWRLDAQVIMLEWVPAYLELKAVERENQYAKKKSNENNIMISLDSSEKAEIRKNLNLWEPGGNESENNKKNYAPGLGSALKSWLGQAPLTEQWGDKINPIDVEKHKKNTDNSKNRKAWKKVNNAQK